MEQDIQKSIFNTIKETEVEIRVVMAKKNMSIGDLYNLVPGKVIRFESTVSEPVNLAVNNKTFAQGVVVHAGDYYGCELTDIL